MKTKLRHLLMILVIAVLLVVSSFAYYYGCHGDDIDGYYYLVIDQAGK